MPVANRIVRFIFMVMTLVPAMTLLARAQDAATQPTAQEPGNRAPDPSFAPIVDDPKLPRVLLIGDSISMGYTLPVRKMLAGKANVHRPPANCGQTERGMANLDKWLGEEKWDVIHFNFGLHDLKYLDAKGAYVSPDKGKQVAPPDVYEKNLRELVERLKKTNAKLVWASTTPVPEGSLGRIAGDELHYNPVAAKVMADNSIAIDDLHTVVDANPGIQRPKNVHFTPEGYQKLAASVVASVEAALAR